MKRLLIFLFLLFWSVQPAFTRDSVIVPVGNSPTLGPDSAPVVMFEFLDFQ